MHNKCTLIKKSSSPGVLSELLERENIEKSLRRTRRGSLPPNPKSLTDFDELPIRFQRTLTDKKFLIHDSGISENGQVLVLATRKNLEILSQTKMALLR